MIWDVVSMGDGEVLPAADIRQLQDNFNALASGAVGAPAIAVNSLMTSGVASLDTIQVNSAYVDLDAARIVSGTFNQVQIPFESPGPIGSIAPGTGKFSTVEATSGLITETMIKIISPYANSWVKFGAGWAPIKYRKTPDGTVQLRGLMKNGIIGSSPFTLPTGYRPTISLIFAAATSTGYGEMRISSGGIVTAISGGTSWFSVNCNFPTD